MTRAGNMIAGTIAIRWCCHFCGRESSETREAIPEADTIVRCLCGAVVKLRAFDTAAGAAANTFVTKQEARERGAVFPEDLWSAL
jgi:hypothetical protein